jgi:hypothetical protein
MLTFQLGACGSPHGNNSKPEKIFDLISLRISDPGTANLLAVIIDRKYPEALYMRMSEALA